MSTPSEEVKAAVDAEKAALVAKLESDHVAISRRVAALEADAKTVYERHLPLFTLVAGLLIGALTVMIARH